LKRGAGEGSWADRVKKKNEKVLHREAEYPTYKKKEGLLDWQHLKYVLPSKTRYEGKIERAGSRGKRGKKLPNGITEMISEKSSNYDFKVPSLTQSMA